MVLPAAAWVLWLVVHTPVLDAQPPPEEPVFRGRERVTAIDLVVEFEPRASRELTSHRLIPANLTPQDFEVLYSGRSQTVVSVEELEGLDASRSEPWEVVIYFDATLSRRRGLHWAAGALAGRVAELTGRGTVEVALADPFPRTLLEPTRETGTLQTVLSEVALTARARDELAALRYELLRAVEAGADASELAPRVAEEERRVVRRQQDALLSWLTAGAAGDRGGRRALFLVSGGYDLEPGEFYRALLADVAGTEPGQIGGFGVGLGAETEDLARSLAAYGWISFNLTPPPPPPPPRGVRLGKWFFTLAAPQMIEPDPRYHIVDPADVHTERNGRRKAM